MDETARRMRSTARACVLSQRRGSAGVRSRDFAAQLGDRVNIYPVKGYSITVNMAEEDAESRNAAPWVSLLDDDAKIVTSRLGPGRFRIAGTAEFNGYNRDIRHDRIIPVRAPCAPQSRVRVSTLRA